jgi:hypothetical protein
VSECIAQRIAWRGVQVVRVAGCLLLHVTWLIVKSAYIAGEPLLLISAIASLSAIFFGLFILPMATPWCS